MSRTRRSTWTAIAAAWAVLATGTLTTIGPADAAATLVPVTVTLQDTSGAPVVGTTISAKNVADPSYDYRLVDTDKSGRAVLRVHRNITVRLSVGFDELVTLAGGTPVNSPVTVSTGSAGAATTIVVPTRWGRSYRVVDPLGRPVSGANVRMNVLVSTEVSDPFRGTYRMVTSEPWYHEIPGDESQYRVGSTGTDGRTFPMAWFEPEPDPAVACAYLTYLPEQCDFDRDGTPDGMRVELHGDWGYPDDSGVPVPYTQWAVPGSQTMTLQVPAVPVVEVVSQRPGTLTGEAVLTVRVVKPSGSGYVPAEGVRLLPSRYPGGPAAVTDADGIAQIRYARLGRATTVTVASGNSASVATVVTLEPRNGVGFRAAQHNPPGKDTRTRKSLNREWISLVNTSTSSVSLKRWTVRTEAGKRYRFGKFTLRPGATVKLHTGSGRNTRTDRYWGSSRHLWVSINGIATLRDGSGAVVAQCEWDRDKRDGQKTCMVGV